MGQAYPVSASSKLCTLIKYLFGVTTVHGVASVGCYLGCCNFSVLLFSGALSRATPQCLLSAHTEKSLNVFELDFVAYF